MRQRFARAADGTTSLEFALVVPLISMFLFGGLVLGVAAWERNVLQDVVAEAARCIAVAGTACSTVPADCGGSASVCYAVTRAKARGLSSLQASQVSVDPNASINGTPFTTVSANYPFSLVGYSMTLSATASFPNGG